MPEPVPPLSETGWNDPRPLSLNCTVRDEHGATRKLALRCADHRGSRSGSADLAMTLDERRAAFPPAARLDHGVGDDVFRGHVVRVGRRYTVGMRLLRARVELLSSAWSGSPARCVDAGDKLVRRWSRWVIYGRPIYSFFRTSPRGRSRTSRFRSAECGLFISRSAAGGTLSMISRAETSTPISWFKDSGSGGESFPRTEDCELTAAVHIRSLQLTMPFGAPPTMVIAPGR